MSQEQLTVRDLIARDPYENHSAIAPDTDTANHVLSFAFDELDRPVTEFESDFGQAVSNSYIREILERTSPESIT